MITITLTRDEAEEYAKRMRAWNSRCLYHIIEQIESRRTENKPLPALVKEAQDGFLLANPYPDLVKV